MLWLENAFRRERVAQQIKQNWDFRQLQVLLATYVRILNGSMDAYRFLWPITPSTETVTWGHLEPSFKGEI